MNTLSPGDRVLMVETGSSPRCGRSWRRSWACVRFITATDWRTGADPAVIEDHLRGQEQGDQGGLVLHNETQPAAFADRRDPAAIDAAGHPAFSSSTPSPRFTSTDYRHDEWGRRRHRRRRAELMMPPGMSFNALSDKALAAAKGAQLPRAVLGLGRHAQRRTGSGFPTRPRRRCCMASPKASRCCMREGSTACSRADRLAEARAGVRAKGLGPCAARRYYSPTVTAVMLPEGHDADAFRNLALTPQHLLWRELRPRREISSTISATSTTRQGRARRHRDSSRSPAFRTRRAACRAVDYLISAHAHPAQAAAGKPARLAYLIRVQCGRRRRSSSISRSRRPGTP